MNEILVEIYADSEIDSCIRKFVPVDLFEDFKQELFLRLIQFPDGVQSAYKDGRHKYYITRVIINLARWKGDIFFTTYLNKRHEEIKTDIPCEESDFEIRRMTEKKESDMLDKISNIEQKTGSCYYRLMIAAVSKHKSYREVSRQTGIPVKSVCNAMKKIRKILQDD